MAMPDATPALIDRVDPNMAIEHTRAQAARAAARTTPAPPGRTRARSGAAGRPSRGGPTPGRLSTPTSGRSAPARPRHEVVDGVVVLDVLVALGDHGAPPVPAAPTDDVDGGGAEGVGVAHDRADVQVVAPVLDGHVERVPAGVEVGDDRVDRPVPVAVDDVAPVTVGEQVGVEARIVGPRPRVRPDADLRRPGLPQQVRVSWQPNLRWRSLRGCCCPGWPCPACPAPRRTGRPCRPCRPPDRAGCGSGPGGPGPRCSSTPARPRACGSRPTTR